MPKGREMACFFLPVRIGSSGRCVGWSLLVKWEGIEFGKNCRAYGDSFGIFSRLESDQFWHNICAVRRSPTEIRGAEIAKVRKIF